MLNKIQSLHSHTLLSDGKVTHLQSLDLAKRYGIEVIAFTEHDFLPDEKLIKGLQGLNHPTKWFLGIEITVSSFEGQNDVDIHLLGLFVDPFNKALLEHCKAALENRFDKMRQRVKKFQDLGFEVTEEEVIAQSSGNSIGTPHLVAVLTSKERNKKLIRQWAEKMRIAAQNEPAVWKERYEVMMIRGEGQYPYILFFNGDRAFRRVESESSYIINLDQAVKLIREAGGISSIAHYSTAKRFVTAEQLEKLFKEDRLDGIETAYGFWGYGNDIQPRIEADRQMLRNLVKKYNRIATGGGDTHTEKDFEDFAAHAWLNEETVGMVENIMSKKSVDKNYSNLS